jgi:hypothetical protein
VLFLLQVRFFGKFLGTHADYYVFETTLKSPPEEPEQQPGELWRTAVPRHQNGQLSTRARPAAYKTLPSEILEQTKSLMCAPHPAIQH